MSERKPYFMKLDPAIVKRVDHMAVEWDCYRNEAVERLLALGLGLHTEHQTPMKVTSALPPQSEQVIQRCDSQAVIGARPESLK